MICRQCRSSLLSHLPPSRLSSVTYANLSSRQTFHPQSRLYSSPASASSSSSSSPNAPSKTAPKVVSSVPAGTKLDGLNYEKNKQDPIAMEDHEYPDWLWTILDKPGSKAEGGADAADVSSMNKKARRKHEKKMAALALTKPREIPKHEQAIDITPASYNMDPSGVQATTDIETAVAGLAARGEITKSARNARKKAIKESNFLRGL